MRILSCAALLFASGCGVLSPQWEGVWFVEVPALDASSCVIAGDENFDDAEMFDLEDPSGPWTYTYEITRSDSAFFVQVMNGKAGEVFVVVGDEVYPGTADKKLLQVEWTTVLDELDSEAHEDGYLYSHTEVSTGFEKLTIVNPKAGQATGTMQSTGEFVQEWVESDRWRLNQVGFSYSQMPSSSYLTGDSTNLLDRTQCADEECFLRVETACDGQVDLTASFAGKYENGMFGSIEDAGQDPGEGGGGYYTY